MRLREREQEPTPEMARELEAIDRALSGESVDAELAELATLAADLRAERPEPDEEWRQRIDARAAEGFGRESFSSPARRAFEWIRGLRPTQVFVPAGAAATLLVAVAVGVSTEESDPVGGAGIDVVGEGSSPSSAQQPGGTAGPSALPAPGGATSTEESLTGPGAVLDRDASRSSDGDTLFFQRDPGPRGGNAPGVDRRRVERSGYLELSTKPDDVRSVTNRAVEITRSAGGIVISSQLSEQEGVNSSTLQLQVPTRNLDSVLDQLTGLADVKTLNESALDITKPFISARDRLQDASARRRALLEAIANASDEATIADLEQRLQRARRQISRAESRFENIARRARMSNLSVAVTGDPNADSGFSWGEAFDDAGDVLLRVAAIMLITAAIVIPVAIVLGLLLLAVAAVRRHRRERALDE